MNLYLVRHARPQSGGDDPPLSVEGVQQAGKLAGLFERVNPPRDRLTVLASTLRRARVTAEAIAQSLEVAAIDIATFPQASDVGNLTDQLILRLKTLAAAGQTELIVVGHSDYLPPTAARLLGTAAAPFPGGAAFAAVAHLLCDDNMTPATAILRWLLLPELLP
jgi:phosphohistidine phosphatase SixA